MKKRLAVLAIAAIANTLLAVPAAAAKKPVKTTLYLHGAYPAGEMDAAQWVAEGFGTTGVMQMDPNEPSGGQPKSQQWGYAAFNTQCSGLPLFPTWVGNLTGQIVGDATLTLHSISAPGSITARIWVDTPIFSCNDAYIPPAQEVSATVPAGQGSFEVVFEKLKLKAASSVMIEVLGPTTMGRVLYDSTTTPSNLAFNCIPKKGKSCVPAS